jgi:hypothetical protein
MSSTNRRSFLVRGAALAAVPAADVYTASTTFAIIESVRLDLGVGSQVHA